MPDFITKSEIRNPKSERPPPYPPEGGIPFGFRISDFGFSTFGPRVDVVDDGGDVFHRRFGQDAVAEVEDVSGTIAGAAEHVVDVREQRVRRPDEQGRIEIALHRHVAEALPGLV